MSNSPLQQFAAQLFQKYTTEFGTRKAETLAQKLIESSTVTAMLQRWAEQRHIPSPNDVLKIVNSIGWFIFSKNETTGMGAIMVLARWDKQVNQRLNLLDEDRVSELAIGILRASYAFGFKP